MLIHFVNKIADLYHHYSSQTNPQPCYVELDCENEILLADWNGEIGNAVPFSVWNGHTIRWTIPPLLASTANTLLNEIFPIAERVISGYKSVWNGNNNVAYFNEDATEAIEEIEKLCCTDWDESDCVIAWDAIDWASCGGTSSNSSVAKDLKITASSTDEEIDSIVNQLESQAFDEGIHVLEQTKEYVLSIREELINKLHC